MTRHGLKYRLRGDVVTGFSNEALLNMPGGSLNPLLDAIKNGSIRGVVAIVGCNNSKFQHESQNVGLAKELIKGEIPVPATGCIGMNGLQPSAWHLVFRPDRKLLKAPVAGSLRQELNH